MVRLGLILSTRGSITNASVRTFGAIMGSIYCSSLITPCGTKWAYLTTNKIKIFQMKDDYCKCDDNDVKSSIFLC